MRGLEEQVGFAEDSRKENPRYGFQSAYRLSYASYYNPNAFYTFLFGYWNERFTFAENVFPVKEMNCNKGRVRFDNNHFQNIIKSNLRNRTMQSAEEVSCKQKLKKEGKKRLHTMT